MDKKLKNVPVFFASDDNFLPMTAVALKSLIKNASDNYKYEVIICGKPSIQQKRLLHSMVDRNNIILNFYDMSKNVSVELLNSFHLNNYITVETYFRLFIPELFPNYDKFIWLDSDIVINRDIGELFSEDIGDSIIAMCKNVLTIYACYEKNIKPFNSNLNFTEYVMDYLGMADFNNYCNNGISIFNAKKMRENGFRQKCVDSMARLKNPSYRDQDLVNTVCEGDCHFLDLRWNHVWYLQDYAFLRQHLPKELYEAYDGAREDPWIIHYAGDTKPWHNMDMIFSDEFWNVAQQTPFYHQLLKIYFAHNYLPQNKDEESTGLLDMARKFFKLPSL